MAKPLPGAGRLMLAALRNGGTFETCEIFVGLALIRTGLATEEPFQGSPFGALKLTQAGKLVAAQYRSRRRLLARECEVKAEASRLFVNRYPFAMTDEGKRALEFHRARAAKYARWAERLRNG